MSDYQWHVFAGEYDKSVYVARTPDGQLHWAWPNAGTMNTIDEIHQRRFGPGEIECRRSNIQPGVNDAPGETEEEPKP